MREAQWQVENPEEFKNGIILGRLLKIAAACPSIEVFSFQLVVKHKPGNTKYC